MAVKLLYANRSLLVLGRVVLLIHALGAALALALLVALPSWLSLVPAILWLTVAFSVWRLGRRQAARIVLLPEAGSVRVTTMSGLPRRIVLTNVERCEYREFQRAQANGPQRIPLLTLIVRNDAPLLVDLLADIPDEAAFGAVFPNPYVKHPRTP